MSIFKKISALLFSERIDRNQVPREAWLESTLRRIPKGSRILDAGAGELAYKKYCSHLDYVAQDFGQYTGTGDGKGLQTVAWNQTQLDIICDICEMPEPDASFDAIMCVEVFEHLPDPLSALREFSRLLKPGGYLMITAPFCAFTHFSPYFFGTGFSSYWYEEHLSSRGFHILDLQANGNFPAFMMQEVGRIPVMAQKYTTITPSIVEKLALRIVQSLLGKMYRNDRASQEFACFGFHVFAQKQM